MAAIIFGFIFFLFLFYVRTTLPGADYVARLTVRHGMAALAVCSRPKNAAQVLGQNVDEIGEL